MSALEEFQDDIRIKLFTGQAKRRPNESHEAFALRLLGERAADAEKWVSDQFETRAKINAEDAKLWHYSFCEAVPTGKGKDAEGKDVVIRRVFAVYPHELEAFAKVMGVSADKLRKLGEGEIPGPVGPLLRDWQPQPAHHVLGKSYQAPKQVDAPGKPERPFQIDPSQRAQALPKLFEWRTK